MLIRILLVDDHVLVRNALKVLLEGEPEFKVVGEAGGACEGEAAVLELDPDVVVTDLLMPGPGGLQLTRRLARRSARPRIVVMTAYGVEAAALELLRSGASAFVTKTAPSEELFRAIHEAHAGRQYIGAPLSKASIELGLRSSSDDSFDPYQRLTAREREVLQLAAEGLSSPAVSERLFISPRTAETHRARVMRKLGIRNQSELIFFAVRRGLLWIEPVTAFAVSSRPAVGASSGEPAARLKRAVPSNSSR